MNISNIQKVLNNEPAYRLKQVKDAVFKQLIGSWNEANFLPAELREKLTKECPLKIKADTTKNENSSDGMKTRIFFDDDLAVESVLMRHNDGRNTVCVSSMVGSSSVSDSGCNAALSDGATSAIPNGSICALFL